MEELSKMLLFGFICTCRCHMKWKSTPSYHRQMILLGFNLHFCFLLDEGGKKVFDNYVFDTSYIPS